MCECVCLCSILLTLCHIHHQRGTPPPNHAVVMAKGGHYLPGHTPVPTHFTCSCGDPPAVSEAREAVAEHQTLPCVSPKPGAPLGPGRAPTCWMGWGLPFPQPQPEPALAQSGAQAVTGTGALGSLGPCAGPAGAPGSSPPSALLGSASAPSLPRGGLLLLRSARLPVGNTPSIQCLPPRPGKSGCLPRPAGATVGWPAGADRKSVV